MSEALPLIFALYPLLVSSIILIWLWRLRQRNWSSWTVWVLACGSIIAFVYMTSPWAFTSYYLRYVLIGLFVLVTACSYFRMRHSGRLTPSHDKNITVLSVLVLLLFTSLDALAIASCFPARKALSVSFPFGSGTYYILQGGNSIVTNPFHSLGSNRLALDIVKLNSLGNRANGIAPRALIAYEIFNEILYSPCQGDIVRVRDGLPDNPPGNPDMRHPEGNYIVLRCTQTDIFMAHLRHSSIKVAPGDTVTVHQALAEIGNSGNSLEPHLHIDAIKDGTPIGLRFDETSLSINSVITRG